jgi:hypothetical protein
VIALQKLEGVFDQFITAIKDKQPNQTFAQKKEKEEYGGFGAQCAHQPLPTFFFKYASVL